MKMFLSLLFIAIVAIVIVAASGTHNISATEKHWSIVEKAITWARNNSIDTHAKNLVVSKFDEKEVLSSGLEHYHAMCTECHLSPGQKPTEISMGLYPQAPVFHERSPISEQPNQSEVIKKYFWVIKNGLKMTAMPGWGLSHDDKSIWTMAALTLKLHGMNAQQYEEHIRALETDHSHDHGHDDHSH